MLLCCALSVLLMRMVGCVSVNTSKTQTKMCLGNISYLEYEALESLFANTGGLYWIFFRNETAWRFPSALSAPCENDWKGIQCRNAGPKNCTIASIKLVESNLTGIIPTNIGALSSMEVLYLSGNKLQGNIPSEIGKLHKLEDIDISFNILTGSIPSPLFMLSALKSLSINDLALTGTLPNILTTMPSLMQLWVENNSLSGMLPSELGRINSLTALGLDHNLFSGTVPNSISTITTLQEFYLESCYFTGNIPPSIGNLKNLALLKVNSNLMTGELPSDIWELPSLEIFYVSDNFVSGSFPNTIGNLSKLEILEAYYNFFTGTLPPDIGKLTMMTNIIINNNFIEGKIPSTIGNLKLLENIVFSSNLLTGTIPTSLQGMDQLLGLYLDSNSLQGSIPESIGSFRRLDLLQLSFNSLSSTIPSSFARLKLIQSVNLSSNLLTGPITNFLSQNTTHKVLQSVDLSNNALTGSMASINLPPRLEILSLYSNCLVGTLSASICNASYARILILDSLATGPSCRLSIPTSLRGLIRGSFLKRSLHGTVPTCIWLMPNLTALHLSGNGLHGRLGSIPSTSNLAVLDVAANYLTGSIPVSLQTHGKFQQLDLAVNFFSGTLSKEFVLTNSTTLLKLDRNRLSGNIPPAFFCSYPIYMDILLGNIFNCQYNENTLPSQDVNNLSYICGSDDLNNAVFIWLMSVFIFLGIPSMILWATVRTPTHQKSAGGLQRTIFMPKRSFCGFCTAWWSQVTRRIAHIIFMTRRWWVAATGDPVAHTDNAGDSRHQPLTTGDFEFINLMELFAKASLNSSYFMVIICMGLYALMKTGSGAATGTAGSQYTLYTYQYTWLVSSAYLHGLAPAAIIITFVIFSELIIIVTVGEIRNFRTINFLPASISLASHSTISLREPKMSPEKSSSVNGSAQSSSINGSIVLNKHSSYLDHIFSPYFKMILECVAFHVMNVVVILSVNISYVLIVLKGYRSSTLVLIQSALSAFKLMWNQFFISRAKDRIQRHELMTAESANLHAISMSMFNFIIAPCIATLGSDQNCFYTALAGESTIVSRFNEILFDFNCKSYELDKNISRSLRIHCFSEAVPSVTTITEQPTWLYSYQCSSAILSNYVPVLVLIYTWSGIVIPLVQFTYLVLGGQRNESLHHQAGIVSHRNAAHQQDVGKSEEGIKIPGIMSTVSVDPIEMRTFTSSSIFNDAFGLNDSVGEPTHESVHDSVRESNCETANDSEANDSDGISSHNILNNAVGETSSDRATRSRVGYGNDGAKEAVTQPFIKALLLFARWIPALAMPTEISPRTIHRLMENCMLDLAVLLTFGLACPLLSLVIALKQVLVCSLWRLWLGFITTNCGDSTVTDQGSSTRCSDEAIVHVLPERGSTLHSLACGEEREAGRTIENCDGAMGPIQCTNELDSAQVSQVHQHCQQPLPPQLPSENLAHGLQRNMLIAYTIAGLFWGLMLFDIVADVTSSTTGFSVSITTTVGLCTITAVALYVQKRGISIQHNKS